MRKASADDVGRLDVKELTLFWSDGESFMQLPLQSEPAAGGEN